MRNFLRIGVVVGLTIALMAFFLRSADLGSVWFEIRRSRLDLVAVSMLAVVLSYVVRIRRWQMLLAPIGKVGFGAAGRATAIGFATSAVLPGRLGEVVRPYLLARGEHLSASAALATIVLERLLDLIAVLLLLGVFLLFFSETIRTGEPQLLAALKGGGLVAAAGAAVALILTLAAARAPERASAVMARLAGRLPERIGTVATRFFTRFSTGLEIVRRPGRFLGAFAWSFPLWLCVAASAWSVCHAFDIPLPASGSLLVMVLMVLGVSLPTPAGVGSFHAAFQLAVTGFYGAPVDAAVGAALIAHALSFGPITIVGLSLMLRAGLTLQSAVDLASGGSGVRGSESAALPPDLDAEARDRVGPVGTE